MKVAKNPPRIRGVLMPALHLATFSCDVTPPVGHPLCGGWIEPVRGVDDPLKALGAILLGMGQPVVLCAVDWCALRNEAYEARSEERRVGKECRYEWAAAY